GRAQGRKRGSILAVLRLPIADAVDLAVVELAVLGLGLGLRLGFGLRLRLWRRWGVADREGRLRRESDDGQADCGSEQPTGNAGLPHALDLPTSYLGSQAHAQSGHAPIEDYRNTGRARVTG